MMNSPSIGDLQKAGQVALESKTSVSSNRGCNICGDTKCSLRLLSILHHKIRGGIVEE